MSAAVLINMLSIYTNIATNLNASWSCFSSFLKCLYLYLNTHETYFIRSHLFAKSYDSNSDINAPLGKWSCKFKFHGVLQKYDKWSNKFTYSL